MSEGAMHLQTFYVLENHGETAFLTSVPLQVSVLIAKYLAHFHASGYHNPSLLC